MRIPVNDLKRHHDPLAAVLSAAVNRVLQRGWYIGGPEVAGFEQEFAHYCGAAHCIGTGNGTDALELALRALGVRPGDEVATVANAGMYSTAAILQIGALPVYVDVDPGSMTMSPTALDRVLAPATTAVVVTHLYGRMARVGELVAMAAGRGIPLIEDCAQAHGAEFAGRKAGTWGSAGCFSFYPTKNLGAMGDGGAVVTADESLAARIRSLAQYGWKSKYVSALPGGRNSRLDEIQAAILRAKLPCLDEWNARRREIANRYNRERGMPAYGADHVAHLYVVRSPDRDRLRRALAEAGIGSDVHYPIPDHLQEAMRDVPFRRTPLEVTEDCARRVLTVPCFPEMTADEVDEVAAALTANRPTG